MKKILILMTFLLLTTGCTAEYNLTITENSYKEELVIIGENQDEISEFNNNWKIPIDKEENELLLGLDGTPEIEGEIYKYNISNNKLIFNYEFGKDEYSKSTVVSYCYDKLLVVNDYDYITISTSPKVNCISEFPNITSIKVNIQTDKKVVHNNADSIKNNVYTWYITKDNIKNKSLSIKLENNIEEEINPEIPDNTSKEKQKGEYDLYIFLLILLVIVLIGNKLIIKLKGNNTTNIP